MLRSLIVEATFSDDKWSQDHARKWANNHWNDADIADAFVAWLKKQEANDQDYIFKNGYSVCVGRFESENPGLF